MPRRDEVDTQRQPTKSSPCLTRESEGCFSGQSELSNIYWKNTPCISKRERGICRNPCRRTKRFCSLKTLTNSPKDKTIPQGPSQGRLSPDARSVSGKPSAQELQSPALLPTSGTGVWQEGHGVGYRQEGFFPASLEVAFGRAVQQTAPVR